MSILSNARVLWRDDTEVFRDLNMIAEAARRNDCFLLVRPHPSQSKHLHLEWFKTAPKNVIYAADVPLYPLLNSVDIVCAYASTVTVQALQMRRKVVQLKYLPGRSVIPLDDMKVAWIATTPDEVSKRIHDALTDDAEWRRMNDRIEEMLPQQKAAPQIAAHIGRIVASVRPKGAVAVGRPTAPKRSQESSCREDAEVHRANASGFGSNDGFAGAGDRARTDTPCGTGF